MHYYNSSSREGAGGGGGGLVCVDVSLCAGFELK